MASKSQVARYDYESKNNISFDSTDKMYSKLQTMINAYDLILLSDYGKGVLTKNLIKKIIDLASKNNKKVIVEPKGTDYSKYYGASFIIPNKKEAQLATGITIEDNDDLKEVLLEIQKIANTEISLVTLSEDGIAVLKDGEVTIKPTVAREVFDRTGTRDTVLASLGYAISLTNDILVSMEFANLAAGVAVGKLGSATVSLDEIEDYKASLHKSSIDLHIKSFKDIKKVVKRYKKQNKKVVFTNGCFDILHKGHVQYLNEAKALGDLLIVGVNSDESVKRLKGDDRPINNESDRAYLLSALECVDFVVVFEEDTPYELIERIKPDILVKGSDYKDKEVVGSDLVDETILIDLVEGRSTTATIDKILGNK